MGTTLVPSSTCFGALIYHIHVKGTLGPRPPNEEPRASFQSWTTGLQAPGLSDSSFVRVVPY